MLLIDVIYSSLALSAALLTVLILFSYIGFVLKKRRRILEEDNSGRIRNEVVYSVANLRGPSQIVQTDISIQRFQRSEHHSNKEERHHQMQHRNRYEILNEPINSRFNFSENFVYKKYKEVV